VEPDRFVGDLGPFAVTMGARGGAAPVEVVGQFGHAAGPDVADAAHDENAARQARRRTVARILVAGQAGDVGEAAPAAATGKPRPERGDTGDTQPLTHCDPPPPDALPKTPRAKRAVPDLRRKHPPARDTGNG